MQTGEVALMTKPPLLYSSSTLVVALSLGYQKDKRQLQGRQ